MLMYCSVTFVFMAVIRTELIALNLGDRCRAMSMHVYRPAYQAVPHYAYQGTSTAVMHPCLRHTYISVIGGLRMYRSARSSLSLGKPRESVHFGALGLGRFSDSRSRFEFRKYPALTCVCHSHALDQTRVTSGKRCPHQLGREIRTWSFSASTNGQLTTIENRDLGTPLQFSTFVQLVGFSPSHRFGTATD